MLANPPYHRPRRRRHRYSALVLVSAVVALTVVTGLICTWLMIQPVVSYYAVRIYPNVYVMGMDLGRLTLEEATTALSNAPRNVDTELLILTDGKNRWSLPWSEAGMELDVEATVQAAFAIGHTKAMDWKDRTWAWLRRHDVNPVFSVDPQQARRVLERLAPSVAVSPVDATVQLPLEEAAPVIALPGQPGHELDIEATLPRLLTVANGEAHNNQVAMVFRQIPPRITDATPLQSQVEQMLDRRIRVSTYDVLDDETYHWTLGRSDVLTWLRIVPSPHGPSVILDQGALQTTLEGLSAELGEGRGLRLAEAAAQVSDAFSAGGGSVNLRLVHPVRTYTVQAGDTLSSVAANFGVTPWHLIKANPNTDPNWLYVGQQLTIPSQDELTPYAPTRDKRVVVSVGEQRMRVYENGALIYDWPVSTGVSKSPTHTGVFQILDKEENAYASLWDLWMPHFMAIYAAGPGFYNGFHGLPTLSNGRRLWEGSLGSPASYGCIILGLEEAAAFYRWAEVGVIVVVE